RTTALDVDLLDVVLAELDRRGHLKREPGGLVRPQGRSADVDPKTSELTARVVAALAKARFQPPSPEELASSLATADRCCASRTTSTLRASSTTKRVRRSSRTAARTDRSTSRACATSSRRRA